jgi:two-component system nitrate/nitrite response regulator NarP
VWWTTIGNAKGKHNWEKRRVRYPEGTLVKKVSTNRVLLLTEDAVLATGLAAVLASDRALEVDAQIGLPPSIADLVGSRDPHVLLFDFTPEDYPLLLELRRCAPNCKVVLWMRSVPIEIACQAMRQGVRGILRKTLAVDQLLKCLEAVAAGEFWFDKEVTAGFLESRTVELTARESQIVPLVARGLKNKEIAFELNVAEATIRIYLSALFRKLGVKDRYELAIYGIKNMLLPRSAPKGHTGNEPASNGPAESAKTRLHFMVLDKPSPTPVDKRRRTDVPVGPPRERAMRAGVGSTGK